MDEIEYSVARVADDLRGRRELSSKVPVRDPPPALLDPPPRLILGLLMDLLLDVLELPDVFDLLFRRRQQIEIKQQNKANAPTPGATT